MTGTTDEAGQQDQATTDANPALPYESLQPSPEALEWAQRTAHREHKLPDQAEAVLARLHVPGFPELAEELDARVAVYAHRYDSRWRPAPVRRDSPVMELLDQQPGGLRLRAYFWSLLSTLRRNINPQGLSDPHSYAVHNLYLGLAHTLVRKPLPWDGATLSLLLHADDRGLIPLEHTLDSCERAEDAALAPCLEQLRTARLRRHRELVENSHRLPPEVDDLQIRRLQLLLRLDDPLSVDHVLLRDDVFGDFLREHEPGLFTHPGLAELFVYCLTPPGTKPSGAWRERLRGRLAAVPDPAETVRRVLEAGAAVPRAGAAPRYQVETHHRPHVQDILNGLVWAVGELPRGSTPWAAPLLGRIAVFAGTGPNGSKLLRSERVASASVRVLAARGGDESIAALARARAKVRKKTLLRTIDRALDEIAEQLGITSEELLERTVPDFGLDRDGQRADRLGEHRVALTLAADGTAALGFGSAKGRPVASPPKSLRESRPEEVKALRAELKELREVVATERVRLEGFLAEGRTWEAEQWTRYYLEHPVTGVLTRRLLWELSTDSGSTWVAGLPELDGDRWRLVDAGGAAIAGTTLARTDTPEGVRIRLWHPVRHEPAEVRRWRAYLTDRELAQPFKQAYREIYLLTPAEERTRVYSNRFAAHILKYGQAKALLTTRHWSVPQLAGWHGGEDGAAERAYRDRGSGTSWRATLDLAITSHHDIDGNGRATLCATDQVRLYREGQHQPAPLAEVPALVLSEAMRDVDLAVGVASIAADPEWADRGEGTHLGYWRGNGFGELNESAEIRREALERLVPRLRIADRLSIDGRFLKVRGDLRTYRIHLGSANILMEPDDSYLCVVVSGKKGPNVFLPFEEGGGRLSVILSKALLLARDTAIADPGITMQIRRGLDG